MARKPAPRTKGGKYVERIEGIENAAFKAVNDLCEMNPEVDIIDIHYQFMLRLNFEFSRRIAKESVEE